MRFNLEPKRCKSVSLSGKRSVFTLVGLAHGLVTEKLRFPIRSWWIPATLEFWVRFQIDSNSSRLGFQFLENQEENRRTLC